MSDSNAGDELEEEVEELFGDDGTLDQERDEFKLGRELEDMETSQTKMLFESPMEGAVSTPPPGFEHVNAEVFQKNLQDQLTEINLQQQPMQEGTGGIIFDEEDGKKKKTAHRVMRDRTETTTDRKQPTEHEALTKKQSAHEIKQEKQKMPGIITDGGATGTKLGECRLGPIQGVPFSKRMKEIQEAFDAYHMRVKDEMMKTAGRDFLRRRELGYPEPEKLFVRYRPGDILGSKPCNYGESAQNRVDFFLGPGIPRSRTEPSESEKKPKEGTNSGSSYNRDRQPEPSHTSGSEKPKQEQQKPIPVPIYKRDRRTEPSQTKSNVEWMESQGFPDHVFEPQKTKMMKEDSFVTVGKRGKPIGNKNPPPLKMGKKDQQKLLEERNVWNSPPEGASGKQKEEEMDGIFKEEGKSSGAKLDRSLRSKTRKDYSDMDTFD